jgi:hypothetical protein
VPPREERGGSDPGKSVKWKFGTIRFDQIVTQNAVLKILTVKPGKDPLEFDIRDLRLKSGDQDGALDFVSALSNPKPPGEIVSTGSFHGLCPFPELGWSSSSA